MGGWGEMGIHLTIPGEPVAWQRVTRGRDGVARVPQKTRAAKEAIGWEVRRKYPGVEPLSGDVMVMLHFNTDSTSKDLDNLSKLVMDALTGIIWIDDRQVTSLCAYLARKRGKPRTVITVQWWGDDAREDDE
jgi:Holliday junction resolvase RusA-like endonuclease